MVTSSPTPAHSPSTLEAELSWKHDVKLESRCGGNNVFLHQQGRRWDSNRHHREFKFRSGNVNTASRQRLELRNVKLRFSVTD